MKSPVPLIIQSKGKSLTAKAPPFIAFPSINHIYTSPVLVLRHSMSLLPSTLKSLVALL
ncbi:hypothetical protein MBAV_004341 [Candidatus Magnetobacterium bavaricum]|uniref:Uncharacterized protein n=1 Tax=Candidatus Magnetobacterium bavaricum TaxID=29290 RepID=A0A0F3GNF5_9BACT|nr:hypothetical protein MBAV_004341 [Candidatus Magnetobacterium bavaricum]